MSILYLTDNLITGTDATLLSSSEDSLYVLENLSDYPNYARPSKPFRTTGIGSAGNPEYLAVEFDAAKAVTFFGLFNHNLTALSGVNDALLLKGSSLAHAAANWAAPDFSLDLEDRLVSGWNDLYKSVSYNSRTYRLEMIDTANAYGYLEVGDFVFGNYTALSNARLQPGRRESPVFYRAKNVTPYGQDWNESYSDSVTLDLEIWNANNPAQIDAVRTMLKAIQDAGGHFIIVPDSNAKWCYYVALKNDGGFMQSIARGDTAEVSAWTLELETLVKGVCLP